MPPPGPVPPATVTLFCPKNLTALSGAGVGAGAGAGAGFGAGAGAGLGAGAGAGAGLGAGAGAGAGAGLAQDIKGMANKTRIKTQYNIFLFISSSISIV